jgi:hypothetical protein
MDKVVQKWRLTSHRDISSNGKVSTDAVLYAGDQVLLAKSEDSLQYSVYNLNTTAVEFSMEINTEKLRGF